MPQDQTLQQMLENERHLRTQAEARLAARETALKAENFRLARQTMKLSRDLVAAQAAQPVAGSDTVDDAMLRGALQSLRDGFALFDKDLRLQMANNAYLAIFDGIEAVRPGVHYDTLADILIESGIADPEGAPDAWRQRMKARMREDPIPSTTFRMFNRQMIKLVDRRLPDGGVVSLGLNQTDMMRLWAAFETVPDGFVLYDQDDRMVLCNQRYRDLYSESAPAMLPGATFEEILRYGLERGQYETARGREDEWLAERMKDHHSADGVIEQRLANGRWLRILEGSTPDGGRVGLRVDITDAKEAQAETERLRKLADAANEAKSAFLANISHEIRTPMNGVVGMADLLTETGLDNDQRLYVDTIKSSAESLLIMLNDILDFSRIEAGKLRLRPQQFDLEDLVHSVAVLMEPRMRENSVDLTIDYDLFLPTEFVGDAGRMRQILVNLIGNAVKFTNDGHVVVSVTGRNEGDQQRVAILVEDTGVGIPETQTEHVFGKFNQADQTIGRGFEGAGLGLAITRELVAMMDGEIWVESQPGHGSSFCFSVPLPLAQPVLDTPFAPPRGISGAVVFDRPSISRAVFTRQLMHFGIPARCHAPDQLGQKGLTGPGDAVFVVESSLAKAGPEVFKRIKDTGAGPVFLLSRQSGGDEDLPAAIHAVIPRPTRRANLIATLYSGDTPTRRPALRRDRRPTVLAADDNRTNRLVLGRLLAGEDLDIAFATNGVEAVQMFADSATVPDIVLMDISMPVMDGEEAARRIRALEAGRGDGRHTRIVAVTALAQLDDDSDDGPFDARLPKPVRKPQIMAEIARVTEAEVVAAE